MSLLTFAIPTWKRPKYLEKCVRSIADQVRDGRTQILISEDVDDSETSEMIEKLKSEYGFIRHITHHPRTDYADNFHNLFTNVDGEWTWMMGDDDYLKPGALEFMLGHLKDHSDLQFIHCAEESRASGKNGFGKGSLWTLCNTLGWIEMTGFITGNIVKSQALLEGMKTKWWSRYAKTAFAQSCVLLERLKDEPSAFLDVGLVGSQDKEQTEDCAKRWHAANISGRYLYIADVIELMYEERILTQRVTKAFFRYLNYHMWNRYISFFIYDYLKSGTLMDNEMWSKTMKLATFLEDVDFAKEVMAECEAARGMITLCQYLESNKTGLRQELQNIHDRNSVDHFPYCYVKPEE